MKSAKELYDALQNLIEGKHTLRVPPNEDKDEDLIISGAIKELLSLRACAAEKDAEIERQAARIAELEEELTICVGAIEEICHVKGIPRPQTTLNRATKAIYTPTGAKERVERAVWEKAAEIAETWRSKPGRHPLLTGLDIGADFRKRAEGRE